MRACRRIGAMVLLILTATGFPMRAGAEPEHIRIQFSAAQCCPDRTAFARALRQRTKRFQFVSGIEQTRLFVVTITHADSVFSGRLEIQDPGTEVSLRNVSGNTCDEVMAALALMTALAIDPNTLSPNALSPNALSPSALSPTGPANRTPPGSPVSPSPPPDPAPLAPTSSTSSPPEGRDSNPSRSAPPRPQALPPVVVVQSPPALSSEPVSARWKWSGGVHGGASLRMSPTPGPGGVLFVEAAAPGAAVLGPVLRAGLFFSQSDTTLASGAGAAFQWATAMVEGCPVRLVVAGSGVGLYPCLAFHLGVLHGQGQGRLDRPERTTDLWSDLGPVARIRVAVATRFFLEAQGMLVFPLRRLTFEVQDAGPTQAPTTVFAVPRIGALVGMGVAYEFR